MEVNRTVPSTSPPRRTQHDRSEATRAALIAAGRHLFAAEGYAAVGTEAIVQRAGVTRGAMYHQYADKAELFAAVFETVEAEVTVRIAEALNAHEGASTGELLEAGVDAWLDACAEPEVRRIVLLDGPAVLGWPRWREIGLVHGAGLVEAAVAAAIDDGTVADLPLRPLTHVLVGALEEAAHYIVGADDPDRARDEITLVLRRLLRGLAP